MPLQTNKRVYWAIQGAALVANGATAVQATDRIRSLQSLGMTLQFNLEQIFEIGQSSLYDNVENLPSVEVTMEKALDGGALIYHKATPTSSTGALLARTDNSSILHVSIFDDRSSSASGTPNAQVTCSGLFINSLSYNFPVDGNATESVNFVGNFRTWRSGTFTYSGNFDNTDGPESGMIRRQHVIMGSGADASLLPSFSGGGIPGILNNGKNLEITAGGITRFTAPVQSISISTDLGREDLPEIGRKNPFFKYVPGSVEVTTEIEVLSIDGDFVQSTTSGQFAGGRDLLDKRIVIRLADGTIFNMGTKNKLTGVNRGGGEAGGGNVTDTYTYSNFNDLVITHPSDPAGITQVIT